MGVAASEMNDEFAETLAAWHDFYLVVGTASATLLGLLFVAVSIDASVLVEQTSGRMRELANQAFWGLIYLLIFSLVFLVPHENSYGLGLTLLVAGLIGGVRVLRSAPGHWVARGETGLWRFAWRFPIPALAYLLIIAVAVASLLGQTDWLDWLVLVNAILLSMAARSAWELMEALGASMQGR